MKTNNNPARKLKLNPIREAIIGVALLSAGSGTAYAQEERAARGGLEEVVVTATRRSQSMQDVPIAIQALTEDTMVELNVATIDDFVKFLPNVTTSNMGPGQNNMYMRGLNMGGPGAQSAGTNGPWPNVAVYLDEQSTQIPGRNLDVYIADLERIEVLEGPQGTLFGAGAQAGVLRYITNKPKYGVTEGHINASYGSTAHGGENGSFEAVLNIPFMDDRAAARIVAFNDSRGGFIDNVESTFTRRGTDIGLAQRNGGQVNLLGEVVVPGQVPEDSVVINNNLVVEDDFNTVDYKGVRLGLAFKINDDWDILVSQTFQDTDASGVFYQNPVGADLQPLDELEVTVFSPNYTKEEFSNTAWTVNGRVGDIDIVYTGAYLSRESEQVQDYTNYARGVWGTYYQCTGYSGASVDKCYSPAATWNLEQENTNRSHELRFSTPGDWRVRGIAGVFWEKRELNDDTAWVYKTVPECSEGGPASCFLYLDNTQAAKFGNTTFNSEGRRNENTGYVNDFTRTYEQKAIFASVDFDIIPDTLTATFGTRYYEIDNEKLGAFYGSFYCKVYGTGETGPCTEDLYGYGSLAPYGQSLDDQNPNSDTAKDHRSRANLTWNISDDIMVYGTWSEGFRMGGFNRGSGSYLPDVDGVAQFIKPLSYDSDDLINLELGWKTQLLDNTLQFNGAIYLETWEDVATGIFAPQLGLGNTTFTVNAEEYEVRGIEMQFIWQPTDGLTIQGSMSKNDSELSKATNLTNNNPNSPTFGQQIETAYIGDDPVAVSNVFGVEGDPLANAPELQANIRARYEWTMNGYDVFGQVGMVYQDTSLSSATVLDQYEMPSWTQVDFSVGMAKDQWNMGLYVSNLTDENESLFTSNVQRLLAEAPIRPRTVSLRLGYRFGDD